MKTFIYGQKRGHNVKMSKSPVKEINRLLSNFSLIILIQREVHFPHTLWTLFLVLCLTLGSQPSLEKMPVRKQMEDINTNK